MIFLAVHRFWCVSLAISIGFADIITSLCAGERREIRSTVAGIVLRSQDQHHVDEPRERRRKSWKGYNKCKLEGTCDDVVGKKAMSKRKPRAVLY